MSETVALFAEVTIERAALVDYLAARPFSAGHWTDWGPLLDIEVGAPWRADPAGFVAAVDAQLGPTNRATARAVLAQAPDALMRRCDLDRESRRFTFCALPIWEGVAALGPFLVFARGLSHASRYAAHGWATIRWADIDLMAKGIDVGAVIAIEGDGDARFLDANEDAQAHARCLARSNAVYAELFDRMHFAATGKPPAVRQAQAAITTADLVATLDAMSDAGPPRRQPDASSALANLDALR